MELKKYPHNPKCRCGKKGSLIKSDTWWIDAPAYDNCLWVYLRHNQRPHTLLEISKLLNLSISAITSIERKALNTFKKRIKMLVTSK